MDKPVLKKERVKTLFESKFIKVFDLQFRENSHYFDATRRSIDDIVALKSDEEVKTMKPDAVSCIVILKGEEDKLLLTYEFRYVTGQYLLSVPAGLMDKEDVTVIETAKREMKEETGLDVCDIRVVNPLLYSTPGMTDESNALVCVVIDNISGIDQTTNCESTELFDGFTLLTKEEAKELLKTGRDQKGDFYSVYTCLALMYFVSEMYK